MKVITLLPVKNEAWILPYSLANYSLFSDHIIIADQHSTDGSREIYNKFPKVKFFDNNFSGASNKIRWDLLNEARKIPGNNLIIYLDADELLSPVAVTEMTKYGNERAVAFQANWIQLVEDGSKHRVDGVWKNASKEFAFIDDRSCQYEQKELLIDHTARIPTIDPVTKLQYPILHLHYMAKSRSEMKQVWYMCTELLGNVDPRRVNSRYAVAQFSKVITEPVTQDWFEGVDMPPEKVFTDNYPERRDEILSMFNEKGIIYFEPLQIWHIDEFHEKFVTEVGRKPTPSVYPDWLIKLNTIKNNFKKSLYDLCS